MNNKQLTQLNKFKSGKLPITQTALINSDYLTACNLGTGKFETPTYYQIKHGINVTGTGTGCLPIEQLVKIAKKYDIQSISFNDKYKAELETDSGSFFIVGESPDDFPSIPKIDKQSDIKIAIDQIDKLKGYTSTDDLRPAMNGIYYCPDNIEAIATDGHRMRWAELGSNLKFEGFILPNCVIQLMNDSQYNHYPECNVDYGKFEAIISNNERIFYQKIEETYPNYKSVIPPTDSRLPKIKIDIKEAQKAIAAALIVSNNYSNIVELHFKDNEVFLYSCDIDLGQEYKSDSIGTYKIDPGYRIGFNGKYLEETLKDFKKEERFDMLLSGKNRAAIINDTALLMPVMLDL